MTAEAAARRETSTDSDLTPTAFKDVFRRHPAGVAVVTFRHDDAPVGFTATSVISVSADPPVALFSVAGRSSSWPKLADATQVVINFLAADQAEVSARFATSGIDRFAQVDWSWLPSGDPVLHGSTSWLRGRVEHRGEIGESHLVAVVGEQAWTATEDAIPGPLIYHDRVYHALG